MQFPNIDTKLNPKMHSTNIRSLIVYLNAYGTRNSEILIVFIIHTFSFKKLSIFNLHSLSKINMFI